MWGAVFKGRGKKEWGAKPEEEERKERKKRGGSEK